MIRAVIFDVGGVLLQEKVESIYLGFAKELGINFNELMELRKKYIAKVRIGKMSAKEFSEIIGESFALKAEIFDIWKGASIQYMPVNNEVLNLAKRLKKNYKLAILSNTNDIYIQTNNERGVYEPFEIIVNSCEVGFAKPQKEIFEIALQKLELGAEECVYIDDSQEFVEVAKQIGFNAIRFENYLQLIQELKKLGLEI